MRLPAPSHDSCCWNANICSFKSYFWTFKTRAGSLIIGLERKLKLNILHQSQGTPTTPCISIQLRIPFRWQTSLLLNVSLCSHYQTVPLQYYSLWVSTSRMWEEYCNVDSPPLPIICIVQLFCLSFYSWKTSNDNKQYIKWNKNVLYSSLKLH